MLKPNHSLAWNNMVILLDNTGIRHTHAKDCTCCRTALTVNCIYTFFSVQRAQRMYFSLSSKGLFTSKAPFSQSTACSGSNSQETQHCYFRKAGNLNGQQD